MRLQQELLNLPEDLGLSRAEMLRNARREAKTSIETMTFTELKTIVRNRDKIMQVACILLDIEQFPDSGDYDLIDREYIPELEDLITGPQTKGWAQKDCTVAVKAYQRYPRISFKGGNTHATSYPTYCVEVDIVLPNEKTVYFEWQFTRMPMMSSIEGDVSVLTANMRLPADFHES